MRMLEARFSSRVDRYAISQLVEPQLIPPYAWGVRVRAASPPSERGSCSPAGGSRAISPPYGGLRYALNTELEVTYSLGSTRTRREAPTYVLYQVRNLPDVGGPPPYFFLSGKGKDNQVWR
jgi:hypothetical protein